MNPHTPPPRLSRRHFLQASAAAAAGVTLGLKPTYTIAASNPQGADTTSILNYNPDMEYRRCGKTGWMVSAVCLGGHWKRVDQMVPGIFQGGNWLRADLNHAEFNRNRHDVVTRCIERGMNYIDACTHAEIVTYSKALRGRRHQMYLGWSHYEHEARRPEYRTAAKLMQTLDASLKETGEESVDLWRITCIASPRKGANQEPLPAHTEPESEQIAQALAQAKQSGKARHTGISSHDRRWLESLAGYGLASADDPRSRLGSLARDRSRRATRGGQLESSAAVGSGPGRAVVARGNGSPPGRTGPATRPTPPHLLRLPRQSARGIPLRSARPRRHLLHRLPRTFPRARRRRRQHHTPYRHVRPCRHRRPVPVLSPNPRCPRHRRHPPLATAPPAAASTRDHRLHRLPWPTPAPRAHRALGQVSGPTPARRYTLTSLDRTRILREVLSVGQTGGNDRKSALA